MAHVPSRISAGANELTLEQMNMPLSDRPTGPLINNEALDNLRSLRTEGEPDPLAEFVELFLSDTPLRLAKLQTALKNSAARDLEAAAHNLKGSASNLGAQTIATSCACIMQHARNNDFSTAAKFLEAAEADFAQVKHLLLEELKK
jgi:HPt (histidine-containing phosphotransfer) domain-containing protein